LRQLVDERRVGGIAQDFAGGMIFHHDQENVAQLRYCVPRLSAVLVAEGRRGQGRNR